MTKRKKPKNKFSFGINMLIDVRTKEEYDAEHIEGAMLFDIQDMMAKILLEQAGFTNVTDGGGMHDLVERLKRGG